MMSGGADGHLRREWVSRLGVAGEGRAEHAGGAETGPRWRGSMNLAGAVNVVGGQQMQHTVSLGLWCPTPTEQPSTCNDEHQRSC
jgi:hypothetical protein